MASLESRIVRIELAAGRRQVDPLEVEAARHRLAVLIERCLEHCETSDEPLTFPIGAAIQRHWPDVDELRALRAGGMGHDR
jgi:hypothetical protein